MRVLKVDSGGVNYVDDEVVEDALVSVVVNGVPMTQMMAYAQYFEELAIGHLCTSNIIHGIDEVREVRVEGDTAYVELIHGFDADLIHERWSMILEQASDDHEIIISRENDGFPSIDSALIVEVMDELNRKGEVFRSTGGTHSAMIKQMSFGSVFVEDVGRFNAVDKAVGLALMNGFNLGESLLTTSGRLSGEMVLKAAFAGIPVMCSVSAPLRSGIRIAQASGMTLIGFARGQRFNVYSGFKRFST